MGVSETSDKIQIKIKMQNPSQGPPAFSKARNQDLKDMDFFAPTESGERAKIQNMAVSKTVTKPNQDQDAKPQSETSSILGSPKSGLKDIDFLCTFKIKTESQNEKHGCTKEQ